MGEEVEEFWGFAAVGDEEEGVALRIESVTGYFLDHTERRIETEIKWQLTSLTSPRSPCAASQACIKLAATPMDLHVATSFCPM